MPEGEWVHAVDRPWRTADLQQPLGAGPPTELNESDRIEWIPLSEIRRMIDRREIVSSGSLVGLLYLLLDEATKSAGPAK